MPALSPEDDTPVDPARAIAVIGMSCRLPGASTLAEYWANLRNGVESLTHFTDDELRAARILPQWIAHPDYVNANAILGDVSTFDAEFFDIPPAEAEVMDPQQRLFLEVAWEALENAGYPPQGYPGRVGVFAGARFSEYLAFNLDPIDLIGLTDASPIVTTHRHWANGLDFLATRVSFKFNLTGPSIAVQTACSTSLVAMHLGAQSILSGESDLVIAGAVSLRIPQRAGYIYTEGMIFSPDAKTRSFDAGANGTVFSSGAGAVILKRLDQAQADGDRVRLVIRGSAINNDGSGTRKSRFHAPSVPGQAEVIRDALAASGVDPATITYVEAHGTATQVGDPIEFDGLVQAFGDVGRNYCAIGSVKSNIGHTIQAAGAASLIKVALMFEHEELVPTLHFQRPNPRIDLDNSPFYVNTEHRPWPAGAFPRRAGISSFGVGGTNAHLVVEEPPRQPKAESAVRFPPVLALSARSQEALRALAARYSAFLEKNPETPLDDLCFTAAAGRTHFEHRFATYAETTADLRERLAAFADGRVPEGVFHGVKGADGPSIAFLFTGQGAQYPGMGRGLYDTEPVFRSALDECSRLLEARLERPLIEVLFAEDEASASLLNETGYTQPALFALEYALTKLWESWGVSPAFALGHSVGEYAAACAAGVMRLGDGLALIAHRGRLMGSLPQDGEMAALTAGPERLAEALAGSNGEVSLAALNGPESTVISGSREAVRAVSERMEAEGFRGRALNTSHAFHSHLMDPILGAFEQAAGKIDYAQPTIPLISNLTGEPVDTIDAAYWRRHVREPVRFHAGMETLTRLGCRTFLEIGPQPTLLGMGQAALAAAALPTAGETWLPSLRRGRDDREQIYRSLAALYALGQDIRWEQVAPEAPRRRIELPTYPFQRKRFWVEPAARPAGPAISPEIAADETAHPLLGVRLDSPLEDIQFSAEISAAAPAFLGEHAAFGTVIVPATAHIEMAAAAVDRIFGVPGQVITLGEMIFRRPLLLAEGERRRIRFVITPSGAASGTFRIYTRPADSSGEWTLHSSGSFKVEPGGHSPETVDLEPLKRRLEPPVGPEDFYREREMRMLSLGPIFQGVRQIWYGEGEVLGRIELPGRADGYQVHPALLDACLQVTSSSIRDAFGASNLFLPGAWDRITIHGPVPPAIWAHARIKGDPGLRTELRSYDVFVYDGDGRLVISIDGVHMKRAQRSTLLAAAAERETAGWVHEVEWEAVPLPALAAGPELSGRVLVLAGADGAGEALTAALAARGGTADLVHAGSGRANGAREGAWIDPADPEAFRALLASSGPYLHIVSLWGLSPATDTEAPTSILETALARSTRGLLHLVQAAIDAQGAGTTPPRLWIVTRGAQPAGPQPGPFAVEAAALWGLGRVIAGEHPELRPTLVDLDPGSPAGGSHSSAIQPLVDELAAAGEEREIAFRGAARYAARLVPAGRPRSDGGLELPGDRPYRLESINAGTLDGLVLTPALRRAPGPGEIEIRVQATGLNFRDVLVALGRFEDVFGRECSGTVIAVGEGVSDFEAGDAVMAVAPDSFAAYVTIDARQAVRVPAHLSPEQAATIPLAFLTAYYGLHTLAGIRAGDRVLIHAAAGGVGHAAIQIARAAGAEIYATASRGKWAYLHALGVEHVLDSRTLDFSAELKRLTGDGVDIVLNSLSGDFIPASLEALAENGRFIEIGATDVWDKARMAEARPDVAYHWFHLGSTVIAHEPDFFRSMFEAVAAGFADGRYRPLPYRSYDIADTARAFRLMQQARHIGKIVVTHRSAGPAGAGRIDPERTYLLTGAFGGLGLKTAGWLVDRGARHLALLGRRPPAGEALEALKQWQARGVEIGVFQTDIADADSLTAAWDAIRAEMPPLDGVFHLAGVLDDGLLAQQDWSRFETVLAPKIAGTWNLHRLTENLPLTHFILFSSVAALLGSRGQGNYAAANAFLDAVAHFRRAHGLAALSINWGAWAEVGMAADLGAAVENRRTAGGMAKIDPARGMDLLGRLLGEDRIQAAVIPVDWSKYLARSAEIDRATFFSALAPAAPAQNGKPAAAQAASEILQTLGAVGPERREPILVEYLESQIARIGGIPAAALDSSRSLAELGIDSLMAVELRNRIGADLQRMVPMSLFLGNPDIRHLGAFLLEQIGTAQIAAPKVQAPPAAATPASPAPEDPLLVRLRSGGEGRPFFCVHGFGGGVLGYGDLARLVEAPRPFIGIRAIGMDGDAEPDEDIEAMAGRYVQAIRTMQPEGPYDLGGYCLGGVVAYEMARQLQAEGEEVGLVAVIEGHAFGTTGVGERPNILARVPEIRRHLPFWIRDYAQLGIKGIWRRIRLKSGGRRGPEGRQRSPQDLVDDDLTGMPAEHLRVMQLQITAYNSYRAKPYGGKVVVFKAKDQSIGKILFGPYDPSLGWEYVAEEVEVVEVDGGHRNVHLKPHVASLAKALRRALEQ